MKSFEQYMAEATQPTKLNEQLETLTHTLDQLQMNLRDVDDEQLRQSLMPLVNKFNLDVRNTLFAYQNS